MRRGGPIVAAAVLIAVVALRSHLTDHPGHPAPPSSGGGGGSDVSDSGSDPRHSRHGDGDAAELHHHHLEHIHQLNEDRGEHDTAHRHPRAQIAQIEPHGHGSHHADHAHHAAHAHGAVMASPAEPDQFCDSNDGGMVMFMDGFNVSPQSSKMCLNFLFKHAVIDTSGKYFGAIVGSIVLGLVTELVRSNGLMKKTVPWFATVGGSAVLFASQMTLAYLVMLLVMSYDVGMFFGVIAGLTTGHVIKDLKKRHTKKMKRQNGKVNSSSSLLIQASKPINTRAGEESDSSDSDDNGLACCAPGDDSDSD